MIRALSKYRAAARTEISVLETLRGEHGCVRMLRHFEHHSHVCLAFELLGPNLYELMRARDFQCAPSATPVLAGHAASHIPYWLDTPRPTSRTSWTRRVPHPVLIGHHASALNSRASAACARRPRPPPALP